MQRAEVAVHALIVTLVVAATYGVLWLLVRLADILVLFLVSAILAAGLAPTVGTLERTRLPGGRPLGKGPALLLVVVLILAALVLMLTILLTPVVQQFSALLAHLPEYVQEAEEWLAQLRARFPWVPDASRWLSRLPQELQNFVQYFGTAAQVFGRFVSGLFTVTTVLVIVIYMLLEGPRLKRGFLRLWPVERRPLVTLVLDRIAQRFSGWLRGTFVLALSIFAIDTVGLILIGIPYPFLLGLVAGLTELIPVVGPFLGAIPAVVVALFQPTWKLVAVIVLYVLAQQIEQNVLVPRVMSRAVGLSPILAIFAVLVGGALMGIVGVLLSIPVAAALQVILGELVPAVLPHARSDIHLSPETPVPEVPVPENPAGCRELPQTPTVEGRRDPCP
ncbi:MAG: AI-2E family transporter [Armatimonadetes bacterium]|nr:AI-2E family transporter [Armatimonadota bacterium]MDW8152727.1 AI-2E family transporter [Armatimonadota bacterium]